MSAPLRTIALTMAALGCLAGCTAEINEDVHVKPGAEDVHGAVTINGNLVVGEKAVIDRGDLKTINGAIEIKHGARVNRCATVNGSLKVESNAETGDLESVNGNLTLDKNVRVKGDVKLVNGGVTLQHGSTVLGNIETVNGAINLYGATVEGLVENYNGGMTITDGSLIKGGITIHEPGHYDRRKLPIVVIGPDSKVDGDLDFQRPVKLYIHNTASVGNIKGAEAIRYSGEVPTEG